MFAGSALAQVKSAEFLEVFHTPESSSSRARGLAGSSTDCRLHRHGQEFRAPTSTRGALSGGPSAPGLHSCQACVAPAPRVHNNLLPRLSGARPPPLPTSLRTYTKRSGRQPFSPRVVSRESCWPCSLANSSLDPLRHRRLRPPSPAPQPGPAPVGVQISPLFFFFTIIFKAFRELGESPPARPLPPPPQPTGEIN